MTAQTSVRSGPDQTVSEMIAAVAGRTPDAAAVLGHGRPPLTFRALAEEIGRVRCVLNGWGIGCGDRVDRLWQS